MPKRTLKGACVLLGVLALVIAFRGHDSEVGVVRDGDNCVIHLEGATFGQTHEIGATPFSSFLPAILRFSFWPEPKRPKSVAKSSEAELMLWTYAEDAKGKPIGADVCVAEIVDKNGDVFHASQVVHSSFKTFSRIGHSFPIFPRDQEEFKVVLRKRGGEEIGELVVRNPQVHERLNFHGRDLPITNIHGPYQIVLSELTALTYSEVPSSFWVPRTSVWEDGVEQDWSTRWIAADALGNTGLALGIHKEALRFTITVHPRSPHATGSKKVADLPTLQLPLEDSKAWNVTNTLNGALDSRNHRYVITALGAFTPGVHAFRDGIHTNNANRGEGPKDPSKAQWLSTFTSERAGGFRSVLKRFYSPDTFIMLRLEDSSDYERLLVTWQSLGKTNVLKFGVFNSQGRLLPVFLPADATDEMTPEVHFIDPIETEFTVKVPKFQPQNMPQ